MNISGESVHRNACISENSIEKPKKNWIWKKKNLKNERMHKTEVEKGSQED